MKFVMWMTAVLFTLGWIVSESFLGGALLALLGYGLMVGGRWLFRESPARY
jgi:hypothetical protein